MKLIDVLGKMTPEYIRVADTLEIEFGEGIKRDSTIAYEDIFMIHLGTKEGDPSPHLQGITINAFQQIRERIHGILAGNPEKKALEKTEALSNWEVEFDVARKWMTVKDKRYWDSSLRVFENIGRHVAIVKDQKGEPVGMIFDISVGIDQNAITEILELVFNSIFHSEEVDPAHQVLGRKLAAQCLAPFVNVA